MMTDFRRELMKVVEKENALRKINNFLYLKVINKKHDSKTFLSNKINEVDIVTINELLIKKILEYRQVRNYNREEENFLKANVELISKNVIELREKTCIMMDNIIKKQDKLVHSFENLELDSQNPDIMKMKKLINEHSRLFVRFCNIAHEKHKRSIKLFWRSEEKRERTDEERANTSCIEFDNLQHQNKLLRDKLADRKKKIKHEKSKLEGIIMGIQNIIKERKDKEAYIAKVLIPFVEHVKEKCLQASLVINMNLRKRRMLLSVKKVLLKKVGILKYEYLVSDNNIIRSNFKC